VNQPSIDKCIIPECNKTMRTRGLCDVHYTYINGLVKKGRYTWDQLEAAGKSLPLLRPRKSGVTARWLSDVTETKKENP